MIEPEWGPFLFDTSAESSLARSRAPAIVAWLNEYLSNHQVAVSAITVTERARGYSVLWSRSSAEMRGQIEAARIAYLRQLGRVIPVDSAVAVVAGEIMALLPEPPTPAKRTHRMTESPQERLSRWRFDGFIAATALVAGMALVHNNAGDFEAIRGAIERSPERFPGLGPLQLIRCSLLA